MKWQERKQRSDGRGRVERSTSAAFAFCLAAARRVIVGRCAARRDVGAFIAAVMLWVVLAAPAQGSDGVILINQSRALAGGVTSGDTPGFPVTISQAGSYPLTGNLQPTSSVARGTNLDRYLSDRYRYLHADHSGY